jgi:hypothetical protein
MTCKGVVRGNMVQLEPGVTLPEGTEVEIVVEDGASREFPPKGSPQAILEAMDAPPHCTAEDVEALLQAIEKGRRPVKFAGIFDAEMERAS